MGVVQVRPKEPWWRRLVALTKGGVNIGLMYVAPVAILLIMFKTLAAMEREPVHDLAKIIVGAVLLWFCVTIVRAQE